MKKIYNKSKILFVLIIVIMITTVTVVSAACVTSIAARNITYTSELTNKTNAQDAIDELYNKAKTYIKGSVPQEPEIYKGMIPVEYNEEGKTVVADTNSNWYDYVEHKWANAVLVNNNQEEIRNKYLNEDGTYKASEKGKEILEEEILGYFVWIPRYKYKLWAVNNESSEQHAIEIYFQSKTEEESIGEKNGEWLTHPAFNFGGVKLNGIWVGKFENSGEEEVTIKANMASMNSMTNYEMFTAIRNIETNEKYGLSTNEIDTHMMKDTEWGAVAYLYSSVYGTYVDQTGCIERGCEVYINNEYSGWPAITGCAGATKDAGAINTEGDKCAEGYSWRTENGVKASTTGNIYGIYDMSGGNWDATMANMEDSNGNFNKQLSGFPDSWVAENENRKYYDIYPYGTSYNDAAAHSRGLLGTATKETLRNFGGGSVSGWNSDVSYLVYSSYAWSYRGGDADDTSRSGLFAFDRNTGLAGVNFSSRSVLVASQ